MMNTLANTLNASIFKKIAQSTGGLAIILTGIKILGFVEKQVLAFYFGTDYQTGYQVDAYFAAFTVLSVFWDILRGLLEPSYLPPLMAYRARVGDAQSWAFTSTALNLLGLACVPLTIGALILTPQIVALVTPGFVGARLRMTIGLTRLMLTGWGFFALAIITSFTLNSYKRFYLAVVDDIVFKVSGFVGLILLVRYTGIYGIAWGIALGGWLAPVIHLIGMRKQLRFYTPTISLRLEPVRQMFRLMLPLLAGTVCIEGRRLVDNFFASRFPIGRLTALTFGYKLIEFTYAGVAKPLAAVVLPYFSELAQDRQHEQLNTVLMTTLRTVVLIFTPLAACLFCLREPVVRLLFERGAFDAASTELTVAALTFYALGLVSFALDIILLRAYYSLTDTLTPSILEVLTLALHTGLIVALSGRLGHGSIALAFTVAKTVKVLVLFGGLARKNIDLQLPRNLWFGGKIALAALSMAAGINGYGEMATWLNGNSFGAQAGLIASSGVLGLGIFVSVTWLLQVEEMHVILRFLRVGVNRLRA